MLKFVMMGSRVRVTQAAPKTPTNSDSYIEPVTPGDEAFTDAEPRRNQPLTGTPRKRMSAKRRQHIFSENCTGHNVAPCCICGRPVHRHNDRWIVEHKRALGLLGKDVNTNCGPAHYDCGIEKTHTEDLPRIRKAKRQQAMHEGTKEISRRFERPAGMVYDWQKRRYVQSPA